MIEDDRSPLSSVSTPTQKVSFFPYSPSIDDYGRRHHDEDGQELTETAGRGDDNDNDTVSHAHTTLIVEFHPARTPTMPTHLHTVLPRMHTHTRACTPTTHACPPARPPHTPAHPRTIPPRMLARIHARPSTLVHSRPLRTPAGPHTSLHRPHPPATMVTPTPAPARTVNTPVQHIGANPAKVCSFASSLQL